MPETIVPLSLPPGLSSNGTKYDNKNRWYDGSLVRFHEGAIRPVGGWAINRDNTGGDLHAVGKPRGSIGWRANDGNGWIALGTTGNPSKLYMLFNGILTDVTPSGLVNGSADGSIQSGGPYGSGPYGSGPYGGSSSAPVYVPADAWALDTFGEILVACLTSDGKLYSTSPGSPPSAATQITNSPTSCRGLVVTNERFLFALGADGDPRKVQWPARETLTTWTPAASNNAGSYTLKTVGRLMTGRIVGQETLLWTDDDLWAATFIGGTLVYSFRPRGSACGLIGPNAVALGQDGAAYWMGDGQFFQYTGTVRPLPCPVADTVFGDFNAAQQAKVQAVPVPKYKEMWWFYPSADQNGTENDRYVAYNYVTGLWMLGRIGRAAGVGAGVFTNPQLWTEDGYLYTHETGNDYGGEVPFLETGPLEIGNGERTVMLQRIWPDEVELGSLTVTIYSAYYPTDVERVSGPYTLTAPTNVRVSGRQMRLRFEANVDEPPFADGSVEAEGDVLAGAQTGGTDWRLGSTRVGFIPQGYR